VLRRGYVPVGILLLYLRLSLSLSQFQSIFVSFVTVSSAFCRCFQAMSLVETYPNRASFKCYIEREISIFWWAILLWSEIYWQERVGPASRLARQSRLHDKFSSRLAGIPANRASPAKRASPPHVIGPLEYWLIMRCDSFHFSNALEYLNLHFLIEYLLILRWCLLLRVPHMWQLTLF